MPGSSKVRSAREVRPGLPKLGVATPWGGRVMMFRGRREYISFTQSTAYTTVSVVTAYTIIAIVYAVLCVKLVYSLQPLKVVKSYCNCAKRHS